MIFGFGKKKKEKAAQAALEGLKREQELRNKLDATERRLMDIEKSMAILVGEQRDEKLGVSSIEVNDTDIIQKTRKPRKKETKPRKPYTKKDGITLKPKKAEEPKLDIGGPGWYRLEIVYAYKSDEKKRIEKVDKECQSLAEAHSWALESSTKYVANNKHHKFHHRHFTVMKLDGELVPVYGSRYSVHYRTGEIRKAI